jgi:hypothetical protein
MIDVFPNAETHYCETLKPNSFECHFYNLITFHYNFYLSNFSSYAVLRKWKKIWTKETSMLCEYILTNVMTNWVDILSAIIYKSQKYT